MSSNAAASGSRCCVFRRMVVVGATFTVALVVIATNHPRARLTCELENDKGTKGDECFQKELKNDKRSLQNMPSGISGDQSELQSRGQHFWPMRRERRREMTHFRESNDVNDHDDRRDDDGDFEDFEKHHHHRHHRHKNHDHKSDDDDDDDSDDKDDYHNRRHKNKNKHKNDDDDDSGDDKKDEGSKNASQQNNRSGSDQEQSSSILTNIDGVNIGNTITIININTGSQPSSIDSNNGPSNNVSSALNDTSRSAITSAAIQAFCDSIRCMQSQGPAVIPESTSTSIVGNGALKSNDGGRATMMLANWLLLVATLILLHL